MNFRKNIIPRYLSCIMSVNTWALCSAQARKIVRVVLTPHSVAGLRVQEIHDAGLSQFPTARDPLPPPRYPPGKSGLPIGNLGHPLRSMRFLKKVVLPDMMSKGEVEKLYIIAGKLNEDGQRMDVIRSKGYANTIGLNVARESHEWRWRLIPDDKIEHHKEVVASVQGIQKQLRKKAKRDRRPPPRTPLKFDST